MSRRSGVIVCVMPIGHMFDCEERALTQGLQGVIRILTPTAKPTPKRVARPMPTPIATPMPEATKTERKKEKKKVKKEKKKVKKEKKRATKEKRNNKERERRLHLDMLVADLDGCG